MLNKLPHGSLASPLDEDEDRGIATALLAEDLKFTADDVEGDQCPKCLLNLGKQIAAHFERAHKAEEKAAQHYTAILQLLEKAKQNCDAGGFAAFQEKFCPDLGRSRAYELKAIATGKKSIEEIRAGSRERQVRCRASKAESVTVTDSSPATPATNADESAEQRRANRGGGDHSAAPAPRPKTLRAIDRSMKLGAELIEKLKGTSLESAAEQDELVFLNRGAAPGEHTDEVRKLTARAIAGEQVSAVDFTAESTGKTKRRRILVDTLANYTRAEIRAVLPAMLIDDIAARAVARHLKCQPAAVELDPAIFTKAPLPKRTKYLDAVGAKAVLDALPLNWLDAVKAWVVARDARPAPAAPASNSDELEIPLYPRREPSRRLN